MEDLVTVACRTNSREDAVLIARGMLMERERVAKANEWLLDGLLLKASQLVLEGRAEDADFIRVSVRRLRITTC